MWFSSTEKGQEPSSSPAGVRHHLHHHGVGGGDERSRAERPAEAAQFLHRVRVTIVHVQVVIATGGVSLHIKDTELEHDHLALWDTDVPGAFGVGFVVSGEIFTSYKP